MKILQISDCHIKDNEEALVYGVNPRDKLEPVVNKILDTEHYFDAVILTGDISDDGSIHSYQYVANLFAKINKKIYFINGNHDLKKNLISVFSNRNFFQQLNELLIENWLFIGLDSCIEGRDHGFLSKQEMQRLGSLIHKAKKLNYHCVVVTHHHPIFVGTPMIDDCPMLNGSELLNIIEKNKHIKLVVTGHVHNDYSIQIGSQAKLETGPSSFAQFKYGGSNELEDIDISCYGYKTYEFIDDSYRASSVLIHE